MKVSSRVMRMVGIYKNVQVTLHVAISKSEFFLIVLLRKWTLIDWSGKGRIELR